jgi:multiple sugar transport system substrate-binding protein
MEGTPMSTHPIARLLAGVAVASVGLALAGCNAGATGEPGVTTVTVMSATNEFTPAHIEAFEKENDDIKIEFIEYDETRLNAMLTAGDPPDIVRGSPSANLFARGLALPLDDYIAESDLIKEDDLMPVNDLWRWDGTERGDGPRYGMVKDFSPDWTIWQNEAIFEEAGVEPFSLTEPANWDEVLVKGEALKAAGVEYPFGLEWQWGVTGLFTLMSWQQGDLLFEDDLASIDLSTPEALRSFQWLVDYAEAGIGPTSLNPLAEGQDAPAFLDGRMAATRDGFWFGGNLSTEEGAEVATTASLAPAPTFGERISPVNGGVGAWIPLKSDTPDEAWRVYEWYMGGAPAIERAESGWGLPALESLWEYLPDDEPFQQQAIELAKAEVEYIIPTQDSPYMNYTAMNGVIEGELQSAIQGEKSSEEALADAEATLNDLLAKGKDQLG